MTRSVEVEISANAQKLIKALNKSEGALNRFRENTTRAASTLKKIAIAATSFYVVSKAIDTAKDAAVSFVETAAQFEQFETVLQTIEGSAEKAKESMHWITDFTKNTPYQLEQVTESFVKLKAYGLEPTKGLLKTLGDTSAAMGKPIIQAVEAIADAVTGENERLKEFGIKASLQGNKVAYAWTDASGKAKHIVIENNKEIIQSTLEAIFNSKYAGAMQMQSKTWNGLISNIKDNWTLFKKDIMDAGLFNYLKSIVIVVGDFLKKAFGSAKEGAKDFALGTISFIKSTIKGVGYLIDIWNVFKLGLNTLQMFFGKLMQFAVKGLQSFSNAAAKAYNFIMQGWVKFTNFLGRGWTSIINFFIKGWNKFITGISDVYNAVASKLHLPTLKPATVDLKEFKAETVDTIAVAKNFSKELSFWKQYTAENKQEMLEYYGKVATGAGSNFAERFIKAVDATYNKLKKTDALKVDKSKYEEQLKKLGAKDGAFKGFEKAAKKAGHTAKKAHADAIKKAKQYQKELQKVAKEAEKVKNQYADTFKSSFESILSGDFKGGINSLFSDIGKKLMQPMLDNVSKQLSSGLSSLTAGLDPLTSALVGFGIQEMPSLWGEALSNKLSDAEIKAGKGRSEFNSKYFKSSLSLWTKYAKEGNAIAVKQLARLKSMDAKFATIGLAITSVKNGFRLDGRDMQAKENNVLFGLFSSKQTPLGSGIEIAPQSIEQLTRAIKAQGYQSYKKESSSLFGLIHNESIKTNYRNLSDTMTRTLQETVNDTLDSVADNLEVLGFDKAKFEEAIKQQVVNLGKIDFKDITDPQQQIQVLKSALGEMLGSAVEGALDSFANPQMLSNLYAWQQAGEDILSTTSRLAVGFQQAKLYFDFFGQSLQNFNQSQELIKAAGGLDKFTSAMNVFIKNFFTSKEQREFLKMQLQHALSVYKVALPASKAQFKALVLETQQKIVAVKAQIDAMKAEIAMKVASGKMTIAQAYGELQVKSQIANAQADVLNYQIRANNYYIESANRAGKASINYGKNVHNSVRAMITGVASRAAQVAKSAFMQVGHLDYSRITSPAIRIAQAELSRLEGLYGTLMGHMSEFADYYNGLEDASNKAIEAMDALQKRLLNIANLKAEWTGDKLESARIILEATKKYTKLTGLTYENFLEKFEEASSKKDFSDKDLEKWKMMSDAIRQYHDAMESLNRGLAEFKKSAREAFLGILPANNNQYKGGLQRAIALQDWGQAQKEYKALLKSYRNEGLSREELFLKSAKLNRVIQNIENRDDPQVRELKLINKKLEETNAELEKLREEQRELQTQIINNTQQDLIIGA